MKIRAKYFVKSETPLIYYHFLTKFALIAGLILSALYSVSYGLQGQVLMCLLSVANIFFCAFSQNLLLRMEWNGVRLLLAGYLFSVVFRIAIACIYVAQGFSAVSAIAEAVVFAIFLFLNWVYFRKRRPLFSPFPTEYAAIPNDVYHAQENSFKKFSEMEHESNEDPVPVVEVYRSNFRVPCSKEIPEDDKKDTHAHRRSYAKIAMLSASLLIGVVGMVFGITQWNIAKNAEAELTQMESRMESLKETQSRLIEKIAEANEEIEQWEDLFDKYATLFDNSGSYLIESAFLRNNIGFIVEGSQYYHNYRCSIFQEADEYWAHNLEYCEYLGYSKCPFCW